VLWGLFGRVIWGLHFVAVVVAVVAVVAVVRVMVLGAARYWARGFSTANINPSVAGIVGNANKGNLAGQCLGNPLGGLFRVDTTACITLERRHVLSATNGEIPESDYISSNTLVTTCFHIIEVR